MLYLIKTNKQKHYLPQTNSEQQQKAAVERTSSVGLYHSLEDVLNLKGEEIWLQRYLPLSDTLLNSQSRYVSFPVLIYMFRCKRTSNRL